ncbi:OadG family protein [bacterium]|nr:OadG family protein [bacterium]
MNPFLVVTNAGGSFEDVLVLSITGIIVVVLGLFVLSLVVSLFRFLNPKSQVVVESNPKIASQPPVEEINKSLFFDVSQLDTNQVSAIFAAVSIELKLYHEIEPAELTFDYQPRAISPWSMAN